MKQMNEKTVRQDRRIRYSIVFLTLIAALVVMMVLNITIGNVEISPKQILDILFGQAQESSEFKIIRMIRLPRLIMAALLGGALALSGFLLQTFFENPIAGPFVLGISSGAKLTVAVVMIGYLGQLKALSSWTMIGAAFVGSLISTGFILLIAKRVHHAASLLVAGMMIGYITSALTDFMLAFANDSDIVSLRSWSMGSFSSMSWSNVTVSLSVIGITLLLTFFLAKPIGAFQLGEDYARSMGVNVKAFRVVLILLSSVLSACVTAFAGPVSFVGIAVPFLVRQMLGSAKPIVAIPAIFLGGAVFTMGCDLIARVAFAPTELSISTVTSLFGAPIVILMLIRRRRRV